MSSSLEKLLPLLVFVVATILSIAACYYVTIEQGNIPVVYLEVRE